MGEKEKDFNQKPAIIETSGQASAATGESPANAMAGPTFEKKHFASKGERDAAALKIFGQPEEDAPMLLRRLYIDEGLSQIEIGRMTGGIWTRFTVAARLREWGIPIRPPLEKEPSEVIKARALQELATLFGEELPTITSDLAARRVTIEILAKQKNVNPATLGRCLRRAGYSPVKQGRQPGDERHTVGKLLKVFGEGYSAVLADRLKGGEKIQDLAAEVGISKRTLGPFLKSHGITKKPGASVEIINRVGLEESAVDDRLEKAKTRKRNRGTPQKTAEEKSAFARQQLEGIFGESLPEATRDLQAGVATAKDLAAENNINYSTLRTWLKRAGIEIPRKGRGRPRFTSDSSPAADSVNKNSEVVRIWDLIDINDNSPEANSILERLSELRLSPLKVAAASDGDLRILGFTDKEISYMREQLKKRETGS